LLPGRAFALTPYTPSRCNTASMMKGKVWGVNLAQRLPSNTLLMRSTYLHNIGK